MTGAAWWVVLAAAAIGAAAGITGSMWASRVQRRAAERAEWFRRLQWAWQLSWADEMQSVTAGMVMMDYLARATDRQDSEIIDHLAPIAREVGRFAARYPPESAEVDLSVGDSHTESNDASEGQ